MNEDERRVKVYILVLCNVLSVPHLPLQQQYAQPGRPQVTGFTGTGTVGTRVEACEGTGKQKPV